jgi:hypothetical protein
MINPQSRRPRYLYHFQRFDEERLRHIIKEQKVHCSNPGDFNDPWDCKPWFYTEDFDDPIKRESIADYYQKISDKEGFAPSAFRRQQIEDLRASPSQARWAVQTTSRQLERPIRQRYRVYCLSRFPDVNLMWAHYTDGHRGICLEFSTRNPVFAVAQQVNYCKTLPRQEVQDGEEEALKILLTKSDDWKYEEEYRIIARAGELPAYPGEELLVTRKDFLDLPSGSLTSVIVGCQGDFGHIRGIVDERSTGLQVKVARKVPNHYRLQVL